MKKTVYFTYKNIYMVERCIILQAFHPSIPSVSFSFKFNRWLARNKMLNLLLQEQIENAMLSILLWKSTNKYKWEHTQRIN